MEKRSTLLTMPLAGDGDVVAVRMMARRLAGLIGLDRPAQTRIATAVSEIARNAVGHGGGGRAEFAVDKSRPTGVFEVVIADNGPGIVRLAELLAGQIRFEGGLGRGLPSARRLVDTFDMQSQAGCGTRVVLGQHIPREATARLDEAALRRIAQAAGPQQSDAIAALHEQNRELIESFDVLRERQEEAERLSRELEETNRGVVALYSELDDKADQLRQVSDLKSRFLSHMSHEFRTPLSSILALSRLLTDRVDGDLTEEQLRQVDYIRRSAQSLLELVNDLLDLAKVEAGKLDVKPAEFSVEELFGSLRGALKPLQVNPDVDLVFEDSVGLPTLFSDEVKVTQILRNFISNALKFTERGRVRVAARHLPASRQVQFSVEDTGVGIAVQNQQMIFEEFSQVEGKLQKGGTGLGLSLARRLATLVGGEVSVTSEIGRGSTFTLLLPVRWGDASSPSGEAGEQPRVLIVDDEEPFRYVIRHIAQDGGFAVLEAEDGAGGLRIARESAPDLIVLDLHMPRTDGFAMLRDLQASDALRRIPVVVCTSQALTIEQKRSLAAAYAIVPKHDLSRDGLVALMHAALPRQRTEPVAEHG